MELYTQDPRRPTSVNNERRYCEGPGGFHVIRKSQQTQCVLCVMQQFALAHLGRGPAVKRYIFTMLLKAGSKHFELGWTIGQGKVYGPPSLGELVFSYRNQEILSCLSVILIWSVMRTR